MNILQTCSSTAFPQFLQKVMWRHIFDYKIFLIVFISYLLCIFNLNCRLYLYLKLNHFMYKFIFPELISINRTSVSIQVIHLIALLWRFFLLPVTVVHSICLVNIIYWERSEISNIRRHKYSSSIVLEQIADIRVFRNVLESY